MSRGGIHRKLAQAAERSDNDQCQQRAPGLYAKSRADYEHVLSISPPHEGYASKARRYLQQLDDLERRRVSGSTRRCSSGSDGGNIGIAVAPSAPVAAAPDAATAPQLGADDADQPYPEKRRRLRSKELLLAALEGEFPAEAPYAPATGSTAWPSAASGGPSPERALRRAARSVLDLLGQDCATAGLALYSEGAVHEQVEGPSASSSGLRSPPRSPLRRAFEVRSPFGGAPDVVVLSPGVAAGTAKVDWAAGAQCSCRLHGHCKHVAAALWAVAKEEEGGVAAGNDVADAAASPEAALCRRRDAVERTLEKKTVEELKRYLKWNNQLLAGTKPELLRRVADGAVFGAVPQCPRCGGHLHPEAMPGVSSSVGTPAHTMYRCRKTNRDRDPCGFEAAGNAMERRPFLGAEQFR
mmetsp:Transcript_20330/g.65530  ORF Transcript_20330/g.65530 Transcript_20330/m.65530 type:complete len:411 (+) Transcript_20330:776-2008(+)